MKILLIGGGGYVGNVVAKSFLDQKFNVTIFDNFLYDHINCIENLKKYEKFTLINQSITDKEVLNKNIKNFDAVILLAGLVGDPITKKYPDYANKINFFAIRNTIDSVLKNKIKKLIFISTCSNYGLIEHKKLASENHKLDPKSLYAKQKVLAEKYILQFKKKTDTTVTILRFATAFGVSQRMRFDLTVNEFVKSIHFNENLQVYDPDTWRPYCHVLDFARLIELVLNSENTKVNFEIFNAGGDFNNYTKRMLIEKIKRYYNNCKIDFLQNGPDPRNYRVDFSKVKRILNFIPKISIDDGILEIQEYLNNQKFKKKLFFDSMGNYSIKSLFLDN